MNKQRLERLADYLMTVAPVDFNILTWKHVHSCGFAACAVGWACTLSEFQREGLHLVGKYDPQPVYQEARGWAAVMKFFDLTEEVAWKLFTINGYIDTKHITTSKVGWHEIVGPKDVANAIRKLITQETK